MVSIIPFHLLCHNLRRLALSIREAKHEGAERLELLLKLANTALVRKERMTPAIVFFFTLNDQDTKMLVQIRALQWVSFESFTCLPPRHQ